jgi:hypothetical protein
MTLGIMTSGTKIILGILTLGIMASRITTLSK